MKALRNDREAFLEYMKHAAFDNVVYSKMASIPARKRMMGKSATSKILLKCCYQLVGVEDEKYLQ